MAQDEDLRKRIIVSEIQLYTPARRTPLRMTLARQHYIQFQVGDTMRTTRPVAKKKKHTSWNETLYFDGNDDSVLIAQVYRKQRLGRDKLIASLKDSVGGVLGRVRNGVLEELLGEDTSGTTIKFAFTAETSGGSGADALLATNAIDRAIETAGALGGPVSQVVGLAGSATNTATNTVSELLSFENTWGVLLQRMEVFNKIVGGIAEIHPYTSLAWSVISAASQVLVDQKNRDDRILHLAGTMKDVFTFVEDAEPLKVVQAHQERITPLIQQVTECGYFISEYAKRNSFWLRTAKYTFSDIDTKIDDYKNKLLDLKAAFLEGVSLQTGVTMFRIMNAMEFITESMNLKDIPYALGARYVQEKRCLPGTREGIIREICDILNNPDEAAPRLCLLTGVAGSGKSAVAHSIAQLYDEQERLGSSYCFLRSDVTKRNPLNFFSTVACDLAEKDPQYRSELYRVVENNRSLRNSASISEQVKRFIIEPSKRLHTIGPLIVVVDALDESGNQSNRRDLLRAFSEHLVDLPTNLRFLITARAESDILASLPAGPQVIHKQMNDIPQHIVDADIQKFVRHSLRYHSELETALPNEEWCRLLVLHSQRLFQWASTACKFIDGEGAIGLSVHERLKVLLQSNNEAGIHPLDELYRTILGQLFTLPQAQHKFRDVMALILALNEPLPLASLSSLFDGDSTIRDIIKPLGSLLDGVLNDQKPIRPLHTSFRDFLLDHARSSLFHVNLLPHHSLLIGRASLGCMHQMLRFNLCDLKDSRVCNAAVPDLVDQVFKAIPTHLAYSCQYWMAHVSHMDCTPELLHEVATFFKNYFPFWLEAISLLSLLSPVPYIFGALKTCRILKQWAQGHHIADLAAEAVQFVQLFAPILRDSTPHLYLSAMPQTPSGSPLCQLWTDHLQNHLSVTLGRPANWPAEIHTLQGHIDHVLCVAYAPDGSHIVSGSQDGTIRVWDPITGQCVGGPFQLHTAPVTSVTYSPDANYFVSASRDGTIKIWDAATGQCLGHPFLGHTQAIATVAYSPDGSCIASGSSDRTIRIWNANTGISTGSPFVGHKGAVSSLAYSSDGNQIASGSYDETVRVWSIKTGQCVAGPFKGHTDWIYSIAYSPNGYHVASASRDNTIQVWDLLSGESVGNPFQEHSNWIFSIAYSPDGNHIASGSSDGTVMIWDANTRKCTAGPFQGHTRPVASLSYSPDGSCVISGSWDNTIRIWNASTLVGQQTATIVASQGHQNKITSIAYSPDSNNIVSASVDRTIWVWDAHTGQQVAGPLQASTYPAVYSPDGNHIAFGSGYIHTWNIMTGELMKTPDPYALENHTSDIMSIAYSPDGNQIVSGSQDNTINLWDAHTCRCVSNTRFGHDNWVYSVAYSPNGRFIVSGSKDNTIRIWKPTTGECVGGPFEGHTDAVQSVAYSPDGNCIASGSWDKTVRIWDPITGQCIVGPFGGHTGKVLSIAYSPDGTQIASGSEDKTIRIWNTSTGECIAGPFQGHSDAVTCVAYSSDGNSIVSGSADLCIKVWSLQDLGTFREIHQREDGWIGLSHGSLFYWVPSWARHALHLPNHSLIMSPHQPYKVDINNYLYGESWVQCWK